MLGGGDYRGSGVQKLIVGGEALSRGLAERMQESFGAGAEIINEYGPTEATVGCMHYGYRGGESGRREVEIGKGISNVQVYILDERQEVVGEQVRGELYIGGAGVGRGYVGRGDLTGERFIPDEYSGEAGARLYRTGDVARYLADGRIEYLGRVDEQVKVRGYRIELGEIEAVLQGAAGIGEAVVVARADEGGGQRLVAYVVSSAEGTELKPGELRRYLQEKLPEYMVPGVFVQLAELPLTANGKVDRRALPAAAPGMGVESAYVAARNPTEELLCGIWAEVLKTERVGIDDNFFELGGHSLLATQVISRMRAAFGVEVLLRSLFEQPSVRGLAAVVAGELRGGGGAVGLGKIERASRDGALPLSYAQQRLWFLDQMEPGNAFYNIPLGVRLVGRLNEAALERSLNEIIRRHEVLRTSFANEGGAAVQVIAGEQELQWERIDLEELGAEAQARELERIGRAEAAGAFDLGRGPLLRAKLVKLGREEQVALITMHHIVSDGWSMGVLVREVASLYKAYSSGEESPLAELGLQYADYAVWQREWLAGGVLEEQLGYWREQLAGAPAVLELPTDRRRPAVQSFRGALRALALPVELSQALKKFSSRENVTLFMTLLAAFQILLRRYSGQDRISVGSPI